MKVSVQSVNFDADEKLIHFIQNRLDKLEQYNNRIINSEVYLKVDNNHGKQNKISEIKVHIPGRELVATKQCKSFEEAADQAADALRRQLKKHKQKVRKPAA